jgi:aspartate/methionine/tyrosine aminotransferase
VKIAPFGIEQWMNEYETRCTYNLAETCVDSLTIAQLLELAGHDGGLLDELLPMKLTYGSIEGTDHPRIDRGRRPDPAPARAERLDRAFLEQVAAICDRAGAWLLCDEVYRGIDQADPGTTVSVADIYDRGISTGSMSKAFALAGLRLGWAVAPASLIRELTIHRDYNTISVGMVDDLLASIALEGAGAILDRSRALTRGNLAALSEWIDAQPRISWIKPRSGTTALLKHDLPLTSRDLCVQLLEETGVMLTPGSAMAMEGYLRIGYAPNPGVLAAGLPLLGDYLHSH